MRTLFILPPVLLLCLVPAQAQSTSDAAFRAWLSKDLWPRAKSAGISRNTFVLATKGLTPDRSMPDLAIAKPKKQRQSEFRAMGRYFNETSLKRLTAKGRFLKKKWRKTLARIEKRTGVPANIVLAIWARESGYGTGKMPKNAIRALATSAFMGRRKALFGVELIAALRILQEGHVERRQMGSSWAGALGQPQFLPSKFFDYAVDEDKDGRRDIWNSVPDTLGSIANYLQKFGWQRGRGWGQQVNIPKKVSCSLGGPQGERTLGYWIKQGIAPRSSARFRAKHKNKPTYLLFPEGHSKKPVFIVTPNFYVLKKYNESDAYALFVGHLADRIGGGSALAGKWQNKFSFNRADVRRMQQKLVKLGYDVGGADGLVGWKTRNAIGLWQTANGRPSTCFPNTRLMRELR